ncbi:MAG: ATP-binding protein [Spirochaetes bacterium]|nr:ATP-binding protein [Spirochaetota bacterium]
MANLSQAKPKQFKIFFEKRFLIFSGILLLGISLIVFSAYFFAARQINHTHVRHQLIIAAEAVKARMASEIGADLTLLVNLRTSAVIQNFFMNPEDLVLRELAYAEFEAFQYDSTEGSLFWINNIDRRINHLGLPPNVIAPGSLEAFWYNQALNEAEDHNFFISLDRLTGRLNLLASTPVFIVDDYLQESRLGILGIEFDMAEIARIITAVHRVIDDSIVCYMFNRNREITSSVNTGLIANRISLAAHLGRGGAEAIRVADMIAAGHNWSFIYGNYMFLVDTVPIIPEWNIMLKQPLPGLLALNRPMNAVFFGMYSLLVIFFIIMNVLVAHSSTAMRKANAELTQEKDTIQAMKDNIHQGIFLMDEELKILPQYSKPLVQILSYHTELEGKSILDILSGSLNTLQLQTMKDYFEMIFLKTTSSKKLHSINPISEFEYKVDGQIKTLSTRFHLIEQADSKPAIIGIIQDITREKEFDRELQAQREVQQLEMKNIFDVIQVDPLVFQDFIEDTESNFNYINAILKDKSMTKKQVVTKFFQNVHAMKSNALSLGLETFGKKLHILEDNIKAVLSNNEITEDNILSLAIELETIMQEKDSYVKIVKKIDSYKTSNQIESFLLYSLRKAVENIAIETQKKVELKPGQLDTEILESNLRKPIKDILFQCVRNSIYHGIEPAEERVKKNKKPQGHLAISIKKVENTAEIIFSDDGQGLDWEKIKVKYLEHNPEATDTSKKVLLSSIFSPEFSTSSDITSVAGRGVGLSLVKDLVKENGGAIKVDSSESGLTFKFIFPLAS